jgi:hypothetical protein
MRTVLIMCALLSVLSVFALAQKNTVMPPAGAKSLVITFKDGHQQTFSAADIARVEFNSSGASTADEYPGRFRGKWKVGTSVGGGTFYITLDNHGNASKSIGASHGTWTVVGEEAQITWDDGWRDAIRRVGKKYEKFAYEPGKSFSDSPSNVTDAVNTSPN